MFRLLRTSVAHRAAIASAARWCASKPSAESSADGAASSSPSSSTHAQANPQPNHTDSTSSEHASVSDQLTTATGDGVTRKKGSFLEPSNDIVLEYARHALKREGRDEIPEAIVWKWETTHPPILAQGKQNFYDYTDDIPEHVKPFWHHEYYQQREFFRAQREKKPLKERLKLLGSGLLVVGVLGFGLMVFRVWVDQPKQIRTMREEMLQNSYGRVLELSAGHGQNIGAFPYAVHEVVMCDSSPQQLQSLRYRIPKTAYPKYEIRRMRSEKLDGFADGEFDCVVDMFGLCHVQDPVMALRQMQRVVKPTGMILLLEHGQSSYPWVNWFLDYFEQRHNVNTHGCKWNMPIREYLREARMEIKEMRNVHYGTTYYVVAYPEQLDAYKERVSHSAVSPAPANPVPATA